MSNRYRAAIQGAEILEMREAMAHILDGVMDRPELPAQYKRYVEREITFYDPRSQISKFRPYRRIYERRLASNLPGSHLISILPKTTIRYVISRGTE
ncbi:hypothetical protein F5X96DRAFT_47720 [Biscogniauxia mediterranea]|nr:hypothetical protein F5X96DRAFT_47720 [Biscogniauxia mediterranea]